MASNPKHHDPQNWQLTSKGVGYICEWDGCNKDNIHHDIYVFKLGITDLNYLCSQGSMNGLPIWLCKHHFETLVLKPKPVYPELEALRELQAEVFKHDV